MIEHVRLSQRAKDQLAVVKRHTGITNWNVLCRWAFCLSLAEPTKPRDEDIPSDSSVEMTWKTFGGEHHEVYMALLKQRCVVDGIPVVQGWLQKTLKQHIQRGVGYLYKTAKKGAGICVFPDITASDEGVEDNSIS
ncbi:DNA sulfur modification protein DndE [Maridesulfovibrio sp.]|uniref:DNA sulfur modification protein DndE n=1 Tax=Maridesulfovibrio sp. TaxID=2795000 RepID=UPI0029F59FC5|nr:DNA sulfur modification protein DndE [Maridesulfovibrio sp.]